MRGCIVKPPRQPQRVPGFSRLAGKWGQVWSATCLLYTSLIGFVPLPITFLLCLLGVPAFLALIVDMWAWPAMEQVLHISDLRAERREKERAEEAAAL